MNREEFISAIRTEVYDSSIESTIDKLIHPPGGNPVPGLLEQSDYYKHLTVNEKRIVNNIISGAVKESVFGFLCILDGVRKITDSEDIGKIELSYLSNFSKTVLNNSNEENLSDIFYRA